MKDRTAKTILAISLLALAGCQKPQDHTRDSQRGLLRKQYFDDCMKLVPPGPQSTQYNDWAEVISECNTAAYYQANQAMP